MVLFKVEKEKGSHAADLSYDLSYDLAARLVRSLNHRKHLVVALDSCPGGLTGAMWLSSLRCGLT